MPKIDDTGVYQLSNGCWAFRYVVTVNNKRVERKRNKDEQGNPFKTKMSAVKARRIMIEQERNKPKEETVIQKKTVSEVYKEYCDNGRAEKAYATIKKQDSLWNNHIKDRFGDRYMDEISVAEINDYLSELYYTDNRAYKYVESFLKMFYLIFGQAYSRDYLSADRYYKLCKNRETKIHMPKMKIDEETDVVIFDDKEMSILADYFKGTNAETAFMLGKYCGLRINECYGLKWSDIDIDGGVIRINQQMQYQDGVVKLVSLKTRNAKREIVIAEPLRKYLLELIRIRDVAMEEMAERREQNLTMLMDLSNEKISSLELVNSLADGKMQTVNSMKYHSQKIKAKCGIEFRYHYLRHTYGTQLATMNTPMHILCNQMGHASGRVTQMYYLGNSKEGLEVLKSNLDKIK